MNLKRQVKWLEARCFRLMSWLVGKGVPTTFMKDKNYRTRYLKNNPWAAETYHEWVETEAELALLKAKEKDEQ